MDPIDVRTILTKAEEFRSICQSNDRERRSLKEALSNANTRIAELQSDLAKSRQETRKVEADRDDLRSALEKLKSVLTGNSNSLSNPSQSTADEIHGIVATPSSKNEADSPQEAICNNEIANDISNYFSSFIVDPQTSSEENLLMSAIPSTIKMILNSYQSFNKKYLVFVINDTAVDSKFCHFLSIDDLLALPENSDLLAQLQASQSMSSMPDAGKNYVFFTVVSHLITRSMSSLPKTNPADDADVSTRPVERDEDAVKKVAVKRRGRPPGPQKTPPAKKRKPSCVSEEDADLDVPSVPSSTESEELKSDIDMKQCTANKKISKTRCKVCSVEDRLTKYFHSYQALDHHILEAHPYNTYPHYFRCPYGDNENDCIRHYVKKTSLRQHIEACHPDANKSILLNISQKPKSWQCAYCGCTFLSQRIYSKHMTETHPGFAETVKMSVKDGSPEPEVKIVASAEIHSVSPAEPSTSEIVSSKQDNDSAEVVNGSTRASSISDPADLDEFVLNSVYEISSFINQNVTTDGHSATSSILPEPCYQIPRSSVPPSLPCLLDDCSGCEFHPKTTLTLDDEFVSSCREEILADLYSIPENPSVVSDSFTTTLSQSESNLVEVADSFDIANVIITDDHSDQESRNALDYSNAKIRIDNDVLSASSENDPQSDEKDADRHGVIQSTEVENEKNQVSEHPNENVDESHSLMTNEMLIPVAVSLQTDEESSPNPTSTISESISILEDAAEKKTLITAPILSENKTSLEIPEKCSLISTSFEHSSMTNEMLIPVAVSLQTDEESSPNQTSTISECISILEDAAEKETLITAPILSENKTSLEIPEKCPEEMPELCVSPDPDSSPADETADTVNASMANFNTTFYDDGVGVEVEIGPYSSSPSSSRGSEIINVQSPNIAENQSAITKMSLITPSSPEKSNSESSENAVESTPSITFSTQSSLDDEEDPDAKYYRVLTEKDKRIKITILLPRLRIDESGPVSSRYHLRRQKNIRNLISNARKKGANLKSSFSCKICGQICFKKLAVSQHINENHRGAVGTIMCSVCGFIAQCKSTLSSHRASRHNILASDFTECTICVSTNQPKVIYDCHEALNNHIVETHPNPYPNYIRCPYYEGECEWHSTTVDEYRDHIDTYHHQEDLRNPLVNSIAEMPWQCTICGKVFSSNAHLSKHFRKEHCSFSET